MIRLKTPQPCAGEQTHAVPPSRLSSSSSIGNGGLLPSEPTGLPQTSIWGSTKSAPGGTRSLGMRATSPGVMAPSNSVSHALDRSVSECGVANPPHVSSLKGSFSFDTRGANRQALFRSVSEVTPPQHRP